MIILSLAQLRELLVRYRADLSEPTGGSMVTLIGCELADLHRCSRRRSRPAGRSQLASIALGTNAA